LSTKTGLSAPVRQLTEDQQQDADPIMDQEGDENEQGPKLRKGRTQIDLNLSGSFTMIQWRSMG
jgi:hypothetical protein